MQGIGLKRDIQVLLATYNGQEHVGSLLASLYGQTLKCEILVRDDRSIDETCAILNRESSRLTILVDEFCNVGPCKNFNILLKMSSAPYVALADQDDVWECDKLETCMDLMIRMERRFGNHTPLLVHSDLIVCDASGNMIAPSLWNYQRLNPAIQDFQRLLVQNNVTGCSMLMNRALVDLALPVPDGAVMHDWWLALVAAAAGKIGAVRRSLVRYRQHGNNQLGAVRGGWTQLVSRSLIMNPRAALLSAQVQAGAFYDRYSGDSGLEKFVRLAGIYATISERRYLQRVRDIVENGLWMHDISRNVGFILFV